MNIAKDHTIINEQRKRILTTIVLSIATICGFFSVINFRNGFYLLAFIEVAISGFSVALFFYIRKITEDKKFIIVSSMLMTLLYILLSATASNPKMTVVNFLWFFITPSMTYAVLGKRIGFVFSLIFGITCVVLYQLSDYGSSYSIYSTSACFLSSWYICHTYENGNVQAMHKTEELSLRDELTKLYNRKVLKMVYDNYLRENTFLSYIVLDIDFFKKINDNYGHDIGDMVLVFFANHLNKHFDEIGYVVRMGGEEFCVVLPKIAVNDVHTLCEKCLHDLGQTTFDCDEYHVNFTFSAGISSSPDDGHSYSELLKIADNRLYKAKEDGRNRVVSS